MKNIEHVYDSLKAVGIDLLPTSQNIGYALLLLAVPLVLIATFWRNVTAKEGVGTDYTKLFQAFLLAFALVFYVPLTDVLSLILGRMITAFERPQNALDILTQMGLAGQYDAAGVPRPQFIERVFMGLSKLPNLLIMWIQEGLTLGIRFMMELLRSVLLVFLYLVGPLSIAIGMIPGFHSSFLFWLRAFVSAQLWSLVLTILDNIVFAYNNYFLTSRPDGIETNIALWVNLVTIFMYLISPFLTNFFVSSSAGAIWGKFAAAGAAVFATFPVLGRYFPGSRFAESNQSSNTSKS